MKSKYPQYLFILIAILLIEESGSTSCEVHYDFVLDQGAPGDVTIIEKWNYTFSEPKDHIFRSIPVGYEHFRSAACDAVGNIKVYGNQTEEFTENAPSLFTHQPNTFEVFEAVNQMHIYAYFPMTTGNYVVYFQYTVRGGCHTKIPALDFRQSQSIPNSFWWVLIAANQPAEIRNITIKVSSSIYHAYIVGAGSYDKVNILSNSQLSHPIHKNVTTAYLRPRFAPIPPNNEINLHFNYLIKDHNSSKNLKAYFPISQWQRILELELLVGYLLSFFIILAIFMPFLMKFWYRSPWVVLKNSSTIDSLPKFSSVFTNFIFLSVANSRKPISSSNFNLLILEWLFFKRIEITKNSSLKLSQKFQEKLKNTNNEFPHYFYSVADLFFTDKKTMKLDKEISLVEYNQILGKNWKKIYNQVTDELISDGYIYTMNDRIKLSIRFSFLQQWIIGLIVFSNDYVFNIITIIYPNLAYYFVVGLILSSVLHALFSNPLSVLTKSGAIFNRIWVVKTKKFSVPVDDLSSFSAIKSLLSTAQQHQNLIMSLCSPLRHQFAMVCLYYFFKE